MCEKLIIPGEIHVCSKFDSKPAWKEALDNVKQCGQRQDSLYDQLKDLKTIANKFGFYDAADFIEEYCNNIKH